MPYGTRDIFKRDSEGRWYLMKGKQFSRINRDPFNGAPPAELVYEYEPDKYSSTIARPMHPFETGLTWVMEMDPRGSIVISRPSKEGSRIEIDYGGYASVTKKVHADPTPIYEALGFSEDAPK